MLHLNHGWLGIQIYTFLVLQMSTIWTSADKSSEIVFDSLLFMREKNILADLFIFYITLCITLSWDTPVHTYRSLFSENTKHLLAPKAFSGKTGFKIYPIISASDRYLEFSIQFYPFPPLTYLALVQIDITSTHFVVNLVSGPELNWVSDSRLTIKYCESLP